MKKEICQVCVFYWPIIVYVLPGLRNVSIWDLDIRGVLRPPIDSNLTQQYILCLLVAIAKYQGALYNAWPTALKAWWWYCSHVSSKSEQLTHKIEGSCERCGIVESLVLLSSLSGENALVTRTNIWMFSGKSFCRMTDFELCYGWCTSHKLEVPGLLLSKSCSLEVQYKKEAKER